ncbi:GTP pyrophosphokinase [Vibrio parahaemolyticus]|nr:GTP pyrophosphokinase [Vibrio parahaemolyticus]
MDTITKYISSYDEPEYSGKKVQNAGKALRKSNETKSDLTIFNNWRSSHALPLDCISSLLLKVSSSVDKNALLAKRLKRSPSIINKLKIKPSMSLAKMQDIGGCRAIVETIDQVYEVSRLMKHELSEHELIGEIDYIANPKPSGYRGIHLVYKFNSLGLYPKHDGLMVEVQIRSKTQHYWATAVETMGAYLKQALKSDQGDRQYLDFFTRVGDLFAYYENQPLYLSQPLGHILQRTKTNLLSLNVIGKLTTFSQITKLIQQKQDTSDYYLIIIDMKEHKIRINGVDTDSIIEANKRYTKLEVRFKSDIHRDVALVSATRLEELRETYPNYFSDTRAFVTHLKNVIDILNNSKDIEQPSIVIEHHSKKSNLKRKCPIQYAKKVEKKLKQQVTTLCRKKRMLNRKIRHTVNPEVRKPMLMLKKEYDDTIIMMCKQNANMHHTFNQTVNVIKNRRSLKRRLKK